MVNIVATFFVCVAVVLAGSMAIWDGTNGFNAFTTESKRRIEILHAPKPIFKTAVENQDGVEFMFDGTSSDLTIADFIYTHCPTVCRAMGSEFTQIQEALKNKGLSQEVDLISISFDSENDSPKALKSYMTRYRADSSIWQGVRVLNADQEQSLLRDFGVTVIKGQYGEFIHNAAFYVIKKGQIVRIFDYDNSQDLLSYVTTEVKSLN